MLASINDLRDSLVRKRAELIKLADATVHQDSRLRLLSKAEGVLLAIQDLENAFSRIDCDVYDACRDAFRDGEYAERVSNRDRWND